MAQPRVRIVDLNEVLLLTINNPEVQLQLIREIVFPDPAVESEEKRPPF